MLLSIVIPIYKVEPYITRCLNSILNQMDVVLGEDYEIVAVDDGSPDRSGEITDQLLSNKCGCTVIHQENRGLSEARNAGLAIAKGEYVWYVDSDDWIENDAVSQLIRIIIEYANPDVIMIRSRIENEQGPQNIWHKEWKDESKIKTGLQVLCEDDWLTPAQFYIVKREFTILNNLTFKSGILHEDNHYTPQLLYFAKTVKCTNKVLYHSYVNDSSITNTPNPKRSYDLLSTCIDLSAFADNHDFTRKEERAWNRFISISLNLALFLMCNHLKNVRSEFNHELSKSKFLFYRMRHSDSIKYVIEGYAFQLSYNYIFTYRILSRR